MSSFEKAQVVHGSAQLLRQFLQKQLQPWRWDIMLKNGGIRAERAGKPIPKLALNTTLKAGDVVFIDDAYGMTYIELRKKASQDFRDYVFCPQRGKDTFLNNQVKALLADKTSRDVPLSVKYIKDLVAQLTPLGAFPIRHLIFVSHASEFGEVLMLIRKQKDEKDAVFAYLTWEGLKESIDNKSLRTDQAPNPTLLPRPEDSSGKKIPCALIIRGCSSGVHQILLKKMHDAFAPMIDLVVMPKFYDAADFIGQVSATQYAASIEYFMHRLIVSSKTKLDRAGVISAFKAATLTDWLGNKIPDGDWEDLVGQDANKQARTKELTMKITGRQQPGKFRAHFDPSPLEAMPMTMEQEAKPTTQEIKDFMLNSWMNLPMFQDAEWPYWKRMGLKDLDAFKAFWTFELDPKAKNKKGKWQVRAIRYMYEVRTPLVEKGVMICHYRPKGEPGTESNNIDYNDTRLFGRFAAIPKDFAQRI